MSKETSKLVAVVAGCVLVTGLAAAGARAQQAAGSSQARSDTKAAAKPIRAVVSIPPLKGLVQPIIEAARVGGATSEAAEPVAVLVPAGESEHGFEVPPSKLRDLAKADLVVLVGLGLEPQVVKFLDQNPVADRRVVQFGKVAGVPEGLVEHHHHEQDGEHVHAHGDGCTGSVDPHLWLDPLMVDRLVEAVGREIVAMVGDDVSRRDAVAAAVAATRKQVMDVHERYAVTVGSFRVKTMVVGHDAWRRLADRYGLETVAIAGLDASEPSPKALQAASTAIRDKRLTTVFVEPQLSDKASRRIAEALKTRVAVLDPLGDGDWFRLMDRNLAELKRAMGQSENEPAR